MRCEDLFLAIGSVEESRLLRSEMTVSCAESKEAETPKSTPKRIIRNLFVAAIVISMLAVTAYAVAGFLIYDSPEEMITAIFGDDTGFDHSEGSIRPDSYGGPEGILVEPTFDRVPVDETIAGEDVAPHVDVVGQSVSFNGYTLTIDAFLYDSATRCGFFTYLLENPDGLPEYQLQTTGEIFYTGMPDIVHVNLYGYPYIIREKTTDTCLAATYYFQYDPKRNENLEICLQMEERYAPEEFAALIAEDVEARKQEMTPEEAINTIRDQIGEETFALVFQGMTEAEIIEQCYTEIVAREVAARLEAEGTSEKIWIPLENQQPLKSVTAADGSIILSPVAIHIDITDLDFLHTDRYGAHNVDTGNIDSLILRYQDGTQYIIEEDYTLNYVFSVTDMPEENVATEVIVTPEEDPNGEGYSYVKNSHGYCLLTTMFNRIVDVDEIAAVVINGTELTVDKNMT